MRDPRTESVLTSVGVDFDYVPELPLVQLVSDPSTQVRREENQAPKPEVDRYHKLLKAGAEFPPIVCDARNRVWDGNTRWGAYAQMKRATIPAYVVKATSPAVAKRVGVELNAIAGKRMEKAELVHWLASGNGAISTDDAQRLTGWSAKTIQRVRDAQAFEARKDKLGINIVTVLPEQVRAALSKIHDAECFRAAVILADEAGLTAKDVNRIRERVNELALTDREAALDVINTLRGERTQQIEERRAGLRVSTPLFRQVGLHLGWVIKQGPAGLHDTNPYTAEKTQRYLQEANATIVSALERYSA